MSKGYQVKGEPSLRAGIRYMSLRSRKVLHSVRKGKIGLAVIGQTLADANGCAIVALGPHNQALGRWEPKACARCAAGHRHTHSR